MQLLNGESDPITSEIGFLEHDARSVANFFEDWLRRIYTEVGILVVRRELTGSLETKLDCLLPLTNVRPRRQLLMPTQGNWTAYLDNGWRGTDAGSAVRCPCREIRCRGIRAVSTPDTTRRISGRELGRPGGTMLEVYAADPSCYLPSDTQRAIWASNDGGRWEFGTYGDPFEFEDLERYNRRRVRDRFPPELLDQ